MNRPCIRASRFSLLLLFLVTLCAVSGSAQTSTPASDGWVAIERTNRETSVEAPLLEFTGAQRETGEVLVEGVGAMELTAKESGALRRMDLREAGAITRSLAHFPLQAAFRYNSATRMYFRRLLSARPLQR